MDHEEIIREFIKLLRLHNGGLCGSIHQEPYKKDFFRLFVAAFNSGLMARSAQSGYLGADALASTLGERAPEVATGQMFYDLITFWREWTYAWQRCDELQQKHRTV